MQVQVKVKVNKYLHRCAFSGEFGETDDVTEVDGYAIIVLRYHRLSTD